MPVATKLEYLFRGMKSSLLEKVWIKISSDLRKIISGDKIAHGGSGDGQPDGLVSENIGVRKIREEN